MESKYPSYATDVIIFYQCQSGHEQTLQKHCGTSSHVHLPCIQSHKLLNANNTRQRLQHKLVLY